MASTVAYRHEDYTVAWLCALPLEMDSAEAMLDETHPSLPTNQTDDNTYILGKICNHNIVIACLRSGVYGTTSAATAATQLRSTFKSIRFFLMVGIGGGAPSDKFDIRLGDVVVSKPTGIFGGVVQYDYGKTMAGGRFEHTGMLNKPLSVLLTAVSRLESLHRSTPSRIPDLISEMVKRRPTLAEHSAYCGQGQDQLFDSEYVHYDTESTCDRCDTDRLVIRPPRLRSDPVIHYGLIASGNQVMKDARTRDMLAREFGILCFEMEAAGLMDDFQCLVIRGICDYSDSHKSKKWQGYAAATAAAYAKELLSVVHTVRVVDASLLRSDNKMVCRSDAQDHGVPLSMISSYDHERTHQRLLQKRLVGTAQWFHDHSDFKEWFTGKTISSLWLSGKIGSGKTIIATTVVEAALCRQSGCHSPTVFFYCENDRFETLDTAYILCSLIRQLCEYLFLTATPYPEDVVTKIRKFFGPIRVQPNLTDLKSIFILLFNYVTDTMYIIDGLDALEKKHSKSFLEFIRILCSSDGSIKSRFLLSSREQVPGYINITTFIPGIHQISTHANVLPDIEVYIDTTIADKTLYRKLTDNTVLLEEIKQTLLDKSLGMFLWVSLQLEILWDTCYTDDEIRLALSTLPEGLEQTYGSCIRRISPRDKYASKVLKWVGFAIRPLHIEELREAVAITLDDTAWNAEKMPQRDILIGCCANLVVVDHFDNCARFAHYSVKQYLENRLLSEVQPKATVDYPTSQQGDIECGELCVTYLSFSDFSLQLSKRPMASRAISLPPPTLIAQQTLFRNMKLAHRIFQQPRAQHREVSVPFYTIRTSSTPDHTRYRFLSYAVANWALHTKQISSTSVVWEKFRTLATSFNETWNFHPWPSGGRSKVSFLHALFGWAVKKNHEPLLSIALAAGPSLHLICNLPLIGESLIALHVACKLGYRNTAELLLGFCDAKLRDGEGYTTLHHAASGGHTGICRLLLNNKTVEVDALTELECTPLWLAASNGHDKVVSLLYDLGSNSEREAGHFSQTALSIASGNGHYKVVQQLLGNGAGIESRDRIEWAWCSSKATT
ncbi:hypothetical protein BJX63DRAFT_445035 [Aspergillus granulosus]|uniref:Nucleoside phosphorylase domain-containing protein n=1 Tax=Aspergillus granulosus TaxID=176169 RepID=A0ABR4H347_9EURO